MIGRVELGRRLVEAQDGEQIVRIAQTKRDFRTFKVLVLTGVALAVLRLQGRGDVRVEVIVLGGPGVVAQAQLVAELDAAEIRYILVDRPDELFGSVVCERVLDHETIFGFAYVCIAEVIRIAIPQGRQRLAADRQDQGIEHKVEVIVVAIAGVVAHVVFDGRASADGIEDLVLNVREIKDLPTIQVIHEAAGIIRITCTCRTVFGSNGKQIISSFSHLLPGLIGIIECHIPVVGAPFNTGLLLIVGAGLTLVKVQIIIAVIIIVITITCRISRFHILQVFLPFGNFGCIFRARDIDFRIVIRLEPGIIPITAGRTVIVILRIIRTGKRCIAGPISILAVQVGRAIRNQN